MLLAKSVKVSYITNEEATIKNFMRDPEYADFLLKEVKADGDIDEIKYFQELYDEAKSRALGAVVVV